MPEPNCVCKVCGVEFYTTPSLIRLRNAGQHCSIACRGITQSRERRGAAHHSWRGDDVNVGDDSLCGPVVVALEVGELGRGVDGAPWPRRRVGVCLMAPQKGQKPNTAQKEFNRRLPGAKTNGIRAARQIAQSRQFVWPQRDEPHCVSCLRPRDRREGPVCGLCTRRRLAGLR